MDEKKILINRKYGGFSIKKKICAELYIDDYERFNGNYLRTHEGLINLYLEKGNDYVTDGSKLVLVTIPKDATFYRVMDYDGLEYVEAVVDGKIIDIY